MALGAFLAGVLLAESEYRRELETDLEPFKGLLLGLFFIAVGMGIDFHVVLRHPGLIVALVAAFLLLKTIVLWAMTRTMPIPLAERPVFIVLLAQGGEFGFVVFQAATQGSVIDAESAALLVAVVALSMLLTPVLLLGADRWWAAHLQAHQKDPSVHQLDTPQSAPVILAGFGRYGQIVGRLLFASGMTATVLDHDAEQVEGARRFGWQVYYGDATRLDLLRVAGAADARVLVVAIDDIEQNLALVDLAREHFPNLAIVARARNARHWTQLYQRGVRFIERETLDAALMSGRSVLEQLGIEPHRARTLAQRFRRHSVEQLVAMAPHMGDEARLISMSKAGRQQLDQLLAQERELAERTRGRADDPP
jgi:glutathione-regulated potassium-efflux system ancillary protein KefC